MVELRKRKEAPTAPPPLTKRGSGTVKKLADTAKGVAGKADRSAETSIADPSAEAGHDTTMTTTHPVVHDANGSTDKLQVGSDIDLEGFGGEIELHTGEKTSLKEMVGKSDSGVVIFTYPKASTPGCTTQAQAFRDSYLPITGASLAVYGLSTDNASANTKFVDKQNLQYPLICNPSGSLIKALGLNKPGKGSGTSRGVVVIDKHATIRVHFLGGPQATLDAVLEYVKNEGMTATGGSSAVGAPPPDDAHASEEAAKLADPNDPIHDKAPLADPDTKMDEVPLVREPSKEEAEAAQVAAEVSATAEKLDA